MRTISFAEIVDRRESTVRITSDEMIYVVDLVMAVTGKDRDMAGNVIRRLPDQIFKSSNFVERRNPRGGHPTKLIIFKDAIELIMVLPGKTAKNIRKQFAGIITRYLDGDRSMCHEIETNNSTGKIKSYCELAGNIMKNNDIKHDKEKMEIPPTSYIYATKSSAFPGLVKIGKTCDVANRMSGLNTSCAPAPHVLVAVAQTFNTDRDEKMAHAFFSEARREGEFFEIGEEDVIAYFTMHITAQYNAELSQHISRLNGLGK
jgi:hypothetical protein